MIVIVISVFQLILIQVISAQLSNRDLASQNVLNYLANTPLAGCGSSRRQIDKPPVGVPGSGDLPVNGIAHSLPFTNGMPFGNLPRASGLTNNFVLHNELANNLAFNNGLQNSFGLNNGMALPNTSAFNLPFSNMNIAPQNRMIPNLDENININGLPFNIKNGLPSWNNVPNGLPSLNNLPNGLPGFNNVPHALPGINNMPNALPGFNNVPKGLSSLNNVPNGLPSFNNVPNGLPGFNNMPNGLPSLNNLPNGLPGFNNVPNGIPSLNNLPNGLPGFNNVPNGLPSLNNVPNGLPGFNNVPNGLPSFNNVPNGLPGFNNVPNGFSNINTFPFPNNFPNLNNVPVGQNILNLNNVPAANSLPNINNKPIPNDLPSFNNLPCNAFPLVPSNNGLPLNVPSGNLLPPIKNQMPYLNNFRITGIGIGDGIADINRFPRNGLPDGNMLPDHLQSGNGLTQQVADELSKINDYQTNNGFAGFTNTPSAITLPNNVLVDSRFSSINNCPKNNGLRNYAVEAQNINNMQLNNGFLDVSNVQNYNGMPINEQRFVNSVPFNNGFADTNNFPADTGLPNANSRLVNAINNGMPFSSGVYLNDNILYANNGLAETYVQNTDGNGFTSNDFQFGNFQVPASNCHYDFGGANMPANQNVLPEGVQMFSNVPSDHQSVLMPNNLNLAQELIKNLKIEGNMPFLNGLPVAGITETVTVLNGDQHSELL